MRILLLLFLFCIIADICITIYKFHEEEKFRKEYEDMFATVWVTLILRGLRTMDEVPVLIKEDVLYLLTEMGVDPNKKGK